jgi:hypothetical protein
MFGVAGYGAYNMYTAVSGSGGGGSGNHVSDADATTSTTAGPPSARQISDTAHKFLSAWAAGQTEKAAALTNSAQVAATDLSSYRTQGHITSVRISGIAPTTAGASFSVSAHISYQGLTSNWTYTSFVAVGRDAAGDPAVTWTPSVLNPALAGGDSIVTGTAQGAGIDVTDRNGKVLTASSYPSLVRIIPDLKTRHADQIHGGTAGVETYVEHSDGSAGKVLDVLRKGHNKQLKTTIDATVQAAAEKAVKGNSQASVTALDIHDGTILAVANGDPAGPDTALQGTDAPGSTMKIVTSAALFERGMGPGSLAPCKSRDNVPEGRMYKNDSDSLQNANADLRWDFANSCNTGFITQAPKLAPNGLRDTAAQFGLTRPWNIGTATANDQPQFPDGVGPDELTSEMIGQGKVQASPMMMASVAATAATGSFHEPRIVDSSMIDGRISAAGVSSTVSSELRQVMRAAITDGTASGVMSGFGADSGAKTGSAEVDGQAATNGWFTAFAGDVAVAAVVHDAGFGNTSAGPIVAQVLRAS